MPWRARSRSTTICVAIPAWSVPGSQSVLNPLMRFQRTMMSCSVMTSAWPMCSRPVTFGGGMTIENFGLSRSRSGVKYSPSSQKRYQRCSKSFGSYRFAISSFIFGAAIIVAAAMILGIETSCDETSITLLDRDGAVRVNLIASQIERHQPFGGVVPEIASREHLQHLFPLVRRALAEGGPACNG